MHHPKRAFAVQSLALIALLHMPLPAAAQWNHRYAKLDDFGHHVYLEQHELPVLAHGPSDPAPAPDGQRLAFAARGWLWMLDLETGTATRLTQGRHRDARPRWSPDGRQLAFVRDSGADTSIVLLDLDSGEERTIDTPTIELDPEFSSDGGSLFYTSGESGSLELRRRVLATGEDAAMTELPQVVRNSRRVAGGGRLLYLHGAGPHRVLRERDLESGDDRIVHGETLTYHLSADTHPSLPLIVFSAPIDNDYHLWTLDLDDPRVRHRLTDGSPYAMTPAFSADGDHVYYVEADADRRYGLKRIPTYGGEPEAVEIERWDYGTGTGALELTVTDADNLPLTARVSLERLDGHPVPNPDDATYIDPQSGRPYFYLREHGALTLPEGDYRIVAAHGPMSPVLEQTLRIDAGSRTPITLRFEPIWNADEAGYVSADHHVHLNGDGHFRADHGDALKAIAGEDLDLLSPMSWNRWERRIDRALVGAVSRQDDRVVRQGQEVRSHFHGHIGLLGVDTPFAPWFFGPSNPTLGDPDLTNGDVIAHADRVGAFATYVHPIGDDRDPFTHLDDGPIPLELVSDGVLADRMGLELVCAWTSPLGNAEVWYRLLNVGRPVAAMSGTDGWIDFHRTPAPGTGRVYVRLEGGAIDPDTVLEAAAAGRSFLTTGPALVLELEDGARPGDVTAPGRTEWRVTLASATAIDTLELLVNGEVVATSAGVEAGERGTRSGTLDVPEGGWIAARAYASTPASDSWPTMHARPFAHSSPIWIGEVGSTHPEARAAAAADLLRAIDAAEGQARAAYGERDMPRLYARFEAAREVLGPMVVD